MNNFFTFALTNASGTAQAGGCSGMDLIVYGVMIVAMILIFVFMNRKQKKQDQEIANMRNNLSVGDEITTIGGIIGKVVSIKEETCVIETSRDGTKIRILKSAVSHVDVKAEDSID